MRMVSLVVIGFAHLLAGMGHASVLYRRVYLWDAFLLYLGAVLLLLGAWRADTRAASPAAEERPSVWPRLRGLLLAMWAPRTAGALAAALGGWNLLSGLLAWSVSPWPGTAAASLLWGWGGIVLLMSARRVWRLRRPGELEPPETPPVQQPAWNRWVALPLTVAGWLLLVGGAMVLARREVSGWLETVSEWLQTHLVDMRLDLPLPAALWAAGLLLYGLGMAMIAWARGAVPGPPGAVEAGPTDRPPPDLPAPPGEAGEPRPHAAGGRQDRSAAARPSWRWSLLVVLSQLTWLLVAVAAITARAHGVFLLAWVVALAAMAACIWRVDHSRGVSIRPARVRRESWWLLPALALALLVVSFRLTQIPNSIWGDEGNFWTAARGLVDASFSVNVFDLGVYSFPLMSSIYQGLWVWLFGPTLWAWRMSSVVAGTLTIVPLFFLARKLLGSRVAWSAAAILVSLPYFLAYGRMGYNNIHALLPVTLTAWLLVEAVDRDSRMLAYLAGVAGGLGFYTYTAGYLGMIFAGLVGLFYWIRRRPARRSLLWLGGYLLLGWFFTAAPLLLSGLARGRPLEFKLLESFFGNAFYGEAIYSLEQITRSHPLSQVGTQRLFFDPRLYGLLIGRGVVRTIFRTVSGSLPAQHYVIGPLAGPGVIFFLAGLAWATSQWRRLRGGLWLVWVALCMVLLSMLNTFPPRPGHMVAILPALAVLAAVGVWLFSGLLRRLVGSLWADGVGVVLTLLLVLGGLYGYFVRMPQEFMPDLEDVVLWSAMEMDAGGRVILVLDEPFSPEFRVWGIEEFELPVEYHGIPFDQAPSADFRALCGADCRVFLLPRNSERLLPQLRQQLGDGLVQMHVNPDGLPVGVEFVPPW